MKNFVSGIHWEHWYYFPAVIVCVVIVTGILVYKLIRRRSAIRMLAATSRAQAMIMRYSSSRQIIKLLVSILGIILLGIAVMRPQWDRQEQMVEHQGRDLLIALDISRSMLCQDMNPDRLTYAKQKIRMLIKKLSCERIGLLLFSGAPFLACSLTTDYDSFFMFLDQVDAQTVSSGGTALDQAVQFSLDMFADMPERKNKIMVLFTDGEDFSGNVDAIRHEVQEQGLHIFSCGVGTQEGAPVPLFDHYGRSTGFQKDSQGTVVISRLNEQVLQQLVQDSGGTYIHTTDDDGDIALIMRLVQSFEKEKIDERKKE